MNDVNHLFKTFALTNEEFCRNEENRWKFFKVFGTALSIFSAAAYQFPKLRIPLLALSVFIIFSGIVVLISVYRIIISIDLIGTKLQRELVLSIFSDEPTKAAGLLYPESSQFLRGAAYFFSVHNAMTLVFIAFFGFSSCGLYYYLVSKDSLLLFLLALFEFLLLWFLTYYFSNRPYQKGSYVER